MISEEVSGNSVIKELHTREVLSCIRHHEPISRTDVSKFTGISKSTVSRLIEDLLQLGLVMETGSLEATSKRKPQGICINPDAYYCIGINLTRHAMRIVITTLTMQALYQVKYSICDHNTPDAFIHSISLALSQAIDDSGIDKEKILGVGVGVPGIVDYQNGVIINFASASKLRQIPLKVELEARFPYTFYIDNESNSRALAEQQLGYAVGYSNSIFLSCWDGLGSGIVSNGVIMRGAGNITGEIGHMVINPSGKRCFCGKNGCLEAYCTAETLVEAVDYSLAHGRSSSLSRENLTSRSILEAFEQGDPLCCEHVYQMANLLGLGISNLIQIVNPEIIILAGNMFDESEKFFQAVEDSTAERLFDFAAQNVIFRRRNSNDNVYRIGAAALVHQAFFE